MEKLANITKTSALKKRMLAVAVVISMVFALPMVSNATTITTDVHSSTGTYNLYVRKSGSTDLLGIMQLTHTSTYVYNTFTASVKCGSTTVSVSQKNSSYNSETVSSLSVNASVKASKLIGGDYDKTYGYCSVSY